MPQALVNDHIRVGEGVLGVAHAAAHTEGGVVRPLGMDFRGRTPRVRHARDGGQRLVVDDHARERVGETVGIVGDHDRERLAHVARHVVHEDRDRPRPALR